MSSSALPENIRRHLLATVSVLAIMAGGSASADSNDETSRFWVSTQGSYLFANGAAQPLLKPGTGTPAQSDRVRDAAAVEIAVGGPLDDVLPEWDFRLAYTGIRSQTHRLATTSNSGGELSLPNGSILTLTSPESFTSKIRQGFDVGDFDIGQDIGLGELSGRAFVGMRFASFNQSARASLLGGEGAVELSCSHFFGEGPRVGASGNYPLDELDGIAIGLAGEVAGSALFGSSYHKATVTSYGTSTPVTLDEEGAGNHSQTVFNADASVGFTAALPISGSECLVTAGYMGQAWWGVVDTRVVGFGLAGTGGTRDGSQFFHGPFLNVAFEW